MGYEFFKLADVDENLEVTNGTYSLVVNGGEVQKTRADLIANKSLKNFTEDYEEWLQIQTTPVTVMDYVKTLATELEPYECYINTNEGVCVATISGDLISTKQHAEYLYEKLVSGVKEKHLEICDFINGSTLSRNIYWIDRNNRLYHHDYCATFSTDEIFTDGDITITGALHADDSITTDGPIHTDDFLELYNGLLGTNLSLENFDSNLKVFLNNGDPVKITNISNPTNNTDVANKQYVDTNIAELNGRIGNLVIGGDSTEGNEIIIYMSESKALIDGSASFLFTMQGDDRKLISVEWSLVPTTPADKYSWKTDNLSVISDSYDSTSFTVSLTNVEAPAYSYVRFRIVYSRTAAVIVPEVVDLRAPFNYTGPQGGVVSDYDDNTQYSPGDYCYSDEEDGVRRLYVCIDETDGQWQSGAWELATARDSIELAFNSRLRRNGQDAMWGNLNMNSHKITNVTTPTNGTDAATKAYVDNKTFSLDANGILSFG